MFSVYRKLQTVAAAEMHISGTSQNPNPPASSVHPHHERIHVGAAASAANDPGRPQADHGYRSPTSLVGHGVHDGTQGEGPPV